MHKTIYYYSMYFSDYWKGIILFPLIDSSFFVGQIMPTILQKRKTNQEINVFIWVWAAFVENVCFLVLASLRLATWGIYNQVVQFLHSTIFFFLCLSIVFLFVFFFFCSPVSPTRYAKDSCYTTRKTKIVEEYE